MFGTRKKTIGLDIGDHSIKLVQLERKHDTVRLINYAIQEIFPEGQEYDPEKDTRFLYVTALSDVFKRLKIDPKRVKDCFTSIGGESVSVKQIQTISLTADELESSLHIEARKHLPIGSSDIVLDYQILAEDEEQGKIDVLLVITNRKHYQKHISLLQEIGVQDIVPVIDVDPLALANSYTLLNSVNDDEIVVLINIGAVRTNLVIYHRNGLSFVRDIPYGGNHFTHDLMAEYDVEFNVAEQIKMEKGIFPRAETDDDEPVTSVKMSRPSISLAEKMTQEHLVEDIRRSLRYYFKESGRNDFSHVFLMGGSSKISSMDAYLSGQLHLPVSVYNPLENIQISGNLDIEEEPQLAEAIGLAMTDLASTPGFKVNLNKTAIENREQKVSKRKFWLGLFCYFLLLGAFVAFGYWRDQLIEEKIAERQGRLDQIEAELDALQQNPRYVSEEDVDVLAELEQNRLLWTSKLGALPQVLPEKAVYTKLYFDSSQNKFVIQGLTDIRKDQKELDFVLMLIDAIRANQKLSADFIEVDFDYSKRAEVGEQTVLDFGIICRVRSSTLDKD